MIWPLFSFQINTIIHICVGQWPAAVPHETKKIILYSVDGHWEFWSDLQLSFINALTNPIIKNIFNICAPFASNLFISCCQILKQLTQLVSITIVQTLNSADFLFFFPNSIVVTVNNQHRYPIDDCCERVCINHECILVN